MVVASEVNTDRRPDPESTFAASGAALILDLSPRNGDGFGSFVFDTREENADLYTAVVDLKPARGQLIVRRRAELEDAYLAGGSAAVAEALSRDGLRPGDVDLVVPAQISPSFLKRLPAAIGFPKEKVADFTATLPDTLTTSVFLALDRARAAGDLGPGKKALLLACGSGVTVAAVTYQF
jgi:3-oxoacyl-[acyl-carrier-protein] synthase III